MTIDQYYSILYILYIVGLYCIQLNKNITLIVCY